MKCKHRDGWVLRDGEKIVITPELYDNSQECEFVCNTIGCGEFRKFKFDIEDIREIK